MDTLTDEKVLNEIARDDARKAARIERELDRANRSRSLMLLAPSLPDAVPTPRDVIEAIEEWSLPHRWRMPAELPPDGPAEPQTPTQIMHALAEKRRADYKWDLLFRLRFGDRVRPKPDHFTVFDLDADDCRYAFGEERILFCGRRIARYSMCRKHAQLCYREPWERR